MFWSGETLEAKLDQLIFDENGNSVGDPDKIDCAAYTLTVGPEVYVTPTESVRKAKDGAKVKLDIGEDFKIPAGQFVFLISEERVKIPADSIGFISLKTSSLKFRGLINVSGFHVDPGYYGRIMFSAYNAGPKEIPVQRGEPLANIWLAKLDVTTNKTYDPSKGLKNIPSSTIAGISGEVFSPIVIKDRLDRLENEIKSQESKARNYVIGAIVIVFLGTFINLNAGWIKENFLSSGNSIIEVRGPTDPVSIQVNGSMGTKTDDSEVIEPDSNSTVMQPE